MVGTASFLKENVAIFIQKSNVKLYHVMKKTATRDILKLADIIINTQNVDSMTNVYTDMIIKTTRIILQ